MKEGSRKPNPKHEAGAEKPTPNSQQEAEKRSPQSRGRNRALLPPPYTVQLYYLKQCSKTGPRSKLTPFRTDIGFETDISSKRDLETRWGGQQIEVRKNCLMDKWKGGQLMWMWKARYPKSRQTYQGCAFSKIHITNVESRAEMSLESSLGVKIDVVRM